MIYRFLIRGPLGVEGMPRRTSKYVMVTDTATLAGLHEAVYEKVRGEIAELVGWEDGSGEHMHAFGVGGDKVVFSIAEYQDDADTYGVLLGNLGLEVGGKLRYTYDLGECWQYDLVLKETSA